MSAVCDWQQQPEVIVAGDGTGFDLAASALIERLGFRAEIVAEDRLAGHQPRVVVVRDQLALARATRALSGQRIRFVVLMAAERPARSAPGVHWLTGSALAGDFRRVLEAVAPRAEHEGRVHVTFREREVVGAYVLGAKVKEVADRSFIAESTVKAHYRRVAARYNAAQRPVKNKTQLLLEMLADGWIDLPR